MIRNELNDMKFRLHWDVVRPTFALSCTAHLFIFSKT